jgi:outer membrane protein TolC
MGQANLSLQQARQSALTHNRQIQINKEELASAKDIRKAAFTYFLPSVSAMGDFTYMNRKMKYEKDLGFDKILAGMAQANPAVQADPFYQTLAGLLQAGMLPDKLSLDLGQHRNYLAGITLTQPIFTGGKIYNQYKLAGLNTKVNNLKLELSQSEIIENTDLAYWRLVSLKEKVRLAEQYYTMVQAHVTDVQNLMEADMVTRNDYLKATVTMNDAQLQLLKANDGYTLTAMALNQIMGQNLSTVILPSDTTLVAIDSLETQPSLQDVLSRRKEITALQTGITMNKTMEHLAASGYLPNVLLTAGYNTLRPNPYNSLEDEFGSDWQVSLMAQWDIFHWNERGYTLAAARHSTQAARYKLQEAQELIELEVSQAWFQYKEAIKKISLTESSQVQAKENLRLTTDKFTDSMASSTDVIDAQVAWQKAYSEYIDAGTELRTQRTKLLKACGYLEGEE